MEDQRAVIPGSEPRYGVDACWSSAPQGEQITVTVYLRRNPHVLEGNTLGQRLLSGNFEPTSRAETAAVLGAAPEDVQAVVEFAKEYDLCVAKEDPATRQVSLAGTVEHFASAFKIDIGIVNGEHISYKGPITVPASLNSIIVAVLGLDQRPLARHASL